MSIYVPDIPLPNQTLGDTQLQILTNFTLIQDIFDKNHVDFNAMNAGNHTWVMLQNQTDPSPFPPAGVMAHYSKTTTGVTEWYLQREATAGPTAGTIIQMSTINGTPSATANGQTFLPGGLVLKFGNQDYSTLGAQTIAFTTPFPTSLFSLQVTVSGNTGTTYSVTSFLVSVSGFTVDIAPDLNAGTIYWTAIGN